MFRISALLLGLSVAVAVGCGGARTADGCRLSEQPNCVVCCTDQGRAAECRDGEWSCPSPSVEFSQCPRECPRPPASSMTACVDRDAGTCLGCEGNEVCLTTFHCADAGDGGMECADEVDAGFVGDDRCHRQCDFFDRCAAGESCLTRSVSLGCGPEYAVGRICF